MKVEVTQQHLGSYSVSLWDKKKQNPVEIARGVNDDDIEDDFRIVKKAGDLAGLDGFTLFWVVWITALKFGPGTRYFVRVSLTQGERLLVEFQDEAALTKKFKPFRGEWLIELA
jgi:hypothetical protein